MKHFTLLFTVLALTLNASAQKQLCQKVQARAQFRPVMAQQRKAQNTNLQVRTAKPFRFAPVAKAPQYNQPEGTLYENLSFSGLCSSAYVYWRMESQLAGSVTSIVVSEDLSALYVYNPFGMLQTYTWLKLDKDPERENIYVAHFPQDIYEEVYTPEEYHESFGEEVDENVVISYTAQRLVMGKLEYGGEIYDEYIPDEKQTVDFSWNGEELIQLEDAVIGMVDEEGLDTYYSANHIRIQSVNDTYTELPADAVAERYALTSFSTGEEKTFLVDVAVTDNGVYVGTLYNSPTPAPGWIKGTITTGEDGKKYVTFPGAQYLGIDESNGYHIYFMAGTTETVYVEEEDYTDYITEFTDEIRFILDEEANTLTAVEEKSTLIPNCSKETLYYFNTLTNPRFAKFLDVPATPADPIFTAENFSPFEAEEGAGSLTFWTPCEDVDGNYINPENIYYNVYFDNDKVLFSPEDYEGLEDEISDIPYNFSNNNNLYSYDDYHQIFFYETGFNRVGVQVIYRGGGEERRSNIIWVNADGTETGVHQPAAANRALEVYDLQGRRTNTLSRGIYIVNGRKVIK